MSESKDLPRGLEGLRKLAGNAIRHFNLWQMIDCDAEKDWNVSNISKGNLHKTLERLANEIESERPALTEAERRVLEMWPTRSPRPCGNRARDRRAPSGDGRRDGPDTGPLLKL